MPLGLILFHQPGTELRDLQFLFAPTSYGAKETFLPKSISFPYARDEIRHIEMHSNQDDDNDDEDEDGNGDDDNDIVE